MLVPLSWLVKALLDTWLMALHFTLRMFVSSMLSLTGLPLTRTVMFINHDRENNNSRMNGTALLILGLFSFPRSSKPRHTDASRRWQIACSCSSNN